ncbi:MAG: ThiF family adenylyltransferase [Proteobacteria bacterium]|nr:ThiF family adenylyltransferase [Cystobacterineae bacterium]MCL2259362.1 ThiF family adenylyltransferase [Cystobacterineae bacterium]MCL2314191.1 ThiF family adenylyltransferase [Pseudomonadota bacterium]
MSPVFEELFQQARKTIPLIHASELFTLLSLENPQFKLMDLRETDEYHQGKIAGAIMLPRSRLEIRVEALVKPEDTLVLYCSSDVRSVLAAQVLLDMGFPNVSALKGGITQWIAQGYPCEPCLNEHYLKRFESHINLPEIGVPGQTLLKSARVLIVGMGGLGSPVALYLAAAGVGELGLMDADIVHLSNLPRQILYGMPSLNLPKAWSAAYTLQTLRDDLKLNVLNERLHAGNACPIIENFDIVVDASDNIETREVINAACVDTNTPWVYGSVSGFEGQVSLLDAQNGPCYRCLWPNPPPTPLSSGPLNTAAGLIGLLQANETLKLLLGHGEPLYGRLLLWNSLECRLREIQFSKKPNCPVCSTNA